VTGKLLDTHLKGHLHKLGLADSNPATGIMNEMQLLCYCEALLRLGYCHFMVTC